MLNQATRGLMMVAPNEVFNMVYGPVYYGLVWLLWLEYG